MFAEDGFDQIEQWEAQLLANQREINRLHAEQAALVARLDPHQVAWSSGDRNVTDWLSATLDISHRAASRLRTVAYGNREAVQAELAGGEISLDRAALLCNLAATGLSEADVLALSPAYSLGALYGLWEKRRRVSAEAAQQCFEDRYLVIQPSLDQSAHRFWGLAVGTDGETITRALQQRETELPVLEGQTSGQRLLDALTTLCLDSLTGNAGGEGGEGRAVMVAEVLVDAALAAATAGEAGATLSSGPKVGPQVLSEILCQGQVRILIPGQNQLSYSDLGEAIPPALRALIRARDMGRCGIAGCRSRYRLQIHHVCPRAQGGNNHPDNLLTVCWYHHLVAIHGRGMEIDPTSPPHRRRLRWPQGPHPPPGRPHLPSLDPLHHTIRTITGIPR